jgi:hypothetical protein
MAFTSARRDEIGKVGSGEIIGNVGVVSTYTVFEENLQGGRFVKLNTAGDGVDKIDGSATPTIAGIAKREVASAIEDGGTYTIANSNIVDVIESGVATVDVVGGLTIKKFDPVYVENLTALDYGKATTASTEGNVAVDAYFYKEVDTNVWAIRMK